METIIVSERDFDTILKAIENPPEPNKHVVERNDDSEGQLFKL